MKKIKPNCYNCYYGGSYAPNSHLASCNCENVTEPTVIELDPLFDRERQYVKRKNWEDECDCEHFMPHLSEANGDFELETVCYFNANFDCPFCGENLDVYGLEVEETRFITCDECGKKIAVKGKEI